jgi:hypothetical protein
MQKLLTLRRWLGLRLIVLGMRVYGGRLSWRLTGEL